MHEFPADSPRPSPRRTLAGRLAESVGVQRSAVSHWEAVQGKSPSMSNLRESPR